MLEQWAVISMFSPGEKSCFTVETADAPVASGWLRLLPWWSWWMAGKVRLMAGVCVLNKPITSACSSRWMHCGQMPAGLMQSHLQIVGYHSYRTDSLDRAIQDPHWPHQTHMFQAGQKNRGVFSFLYWAQWTIVIRCHLIAPASVGHVCVRLKAVAFCMCFIPAPLELLPF